MIVPFRLTRKQLYDAMMQHRFIAVRWADEDVTGINCSIARIKEKSVLMDDTPTRVVSYRPISFQEYLTIKIPFRK